MLIHLEVGLLLFLWYPSLEVVYLVLTLSPTLPLSPVLLSALALFLGLVFPR